MAEILLPDSSIPVIAKKYNLSSTTLYGWRLDYNSKINNNKINNNIISNSHQPLEDLRLPENNFIELLPEEDIAQTKPCFPDPVLPHGQSSNSKLSEISLIFNNNISLSLKGNITKSSLIKILSALEEELC